jgi:hypothetical protein
MKKLKGILAAVAVAVSVLTFNCVARAESANSKQPATDSKDIVVDSPDTSITSIALLADGKTPSDVLDDTSLDGYSTYGVYSVTAVAGYDFSADNTVYIRTSGITKGSDLKVMLLDTAGNWKNVDFNATDGLVSATLNEEGQLVIFIHEVVAGVSVTEEETTEAEADTQVTETTEAAADDATPSDSGNGSSSSSSPKTEDYIYIFAALFLAGTAGMALSYKKASR